MASIENRLRKFHALQEKRWKLETAKSARLKTALNDLKGEERRLLALLDGGNAAAFLFAELTLERLRQITRAAQATAADLDRQRKRALELGRQVKQLEQLAERAAQRSNDESSARATREALEFAIRSFEVSAR